MQQQAQAQAQALAQQQQQGAAAAGFNMLPPAPTGQPWAAAVPVAAAGGGGGGFNLPPAAPAGQPALARQASDGLLQLREELVRIQQLSDAGLHPSQLAVARQARAAGQPEAVPERPTLRRGASLPHKGRGVADAVPVPLKRFGSARLILERGADGTALRAGTGLTINAAAAAAQLMSRLNARNLPIPNVDPPTRHRPCRRCQRLARGVASNTSTNFTAGGGARGKRPHYRARASRATNRGGGRRQRAARGADAGAARRAA